MTNKLYVTNLPADTTEDAVRRHFATCGGVADIELPPEHGKSSRGVARVTMTSPAYAAAAVSRLDRAPFEGRELRVSESPIHAEKPPAPTVKIVQQFRERANMAYDLDCSGTPLTIRIFPADGDRWRVEARSTEAADAAVVTASGATRREALDAVLQQWNERASASWRHPIDAAGCVRAMSDVRAI